MAASTNWNAIPPIETELLSMFWMVASSSVAHVHLSLRESEISVDSLCDIDLIFHRFLTSKIGNGYSMENPLIWNVTFDWVFIRSNYARS